MKKSAELPPLVRPLHHKRHPLPLLLVISIVLSCVVLFTTTTQIVLSKGPKVLSATTSTITNTTIEVGVNEGNLIAFTPTAVIETPTITISTTKTPTPTKKPTTPTPTKQVKREVTPTVRIDTSQYTATQIGESTWRVSNVKLDGEMASEKDLFDALNSYRKSRGAGELLWDNGLGDYAKERSEKFSREDKLDSHAGFRDFMSNDGFSKVGFNGLGENSAHLSGPMSGEKIVKEIFGADSEHDGNQLDASWTHVGLSIKEHYININFGRGKR